MAYKVLARKYRSQSFDDVVGQEPISTTLKSAIKTGRVAHGFLFAGTRGVGKTTMARILAKALNCHSFDAPTTEPCCECASCIAINTGEDIDVIEIDGASNRGIDNIRELRQNAIYRPARSRFKIYIIDEVHMLTTESFNALLKILEEPPGHVKFIFATTEPNKVIATIQSRCQRFDFSNISGKAIAGQLKDILDKEKIKFEDDLVLPLAKMANGSMRDALSLLERLISTGIEPLTIKLFEEFLGCANSDKIYSLVEKIGDNDAAGTLGAVDGLISGGVNEVQIVGLLVEVMRDLMVVSSAGSDSELLILTSEQKKRLTELAEKFDTAGLVYSITTLEKLRWTIKNSETARALLEASLLRFALSEHFMNVDTLLAQLKGGAGGAIKKKITAVKAGRKAVIESGPETEAQQLAEPVSEAEGFAKVDGLEGIKGCWPRILEIMGTGSGKGTAGLLRSARPGRFENGVLTLSFPSSAEMSKKMCENNGRKEVIVSVLSGHFEKLTEVVFEIVADENEDSRKPVKTGDQKRDEIISDPAVKTVLMELDATIVGFEEE